MLVLEYKLVLFKAQETAVIEAVRTAQFVRNKCLRLWLDTNASKNKLYTLCAVLAKKYPFANALNSQARQAASERAASAIARYAKPDKSGKRLKKPTFHLRLPAGPHAPAGGGGDPAALLLHLTVTPPTGIEPQHVTPTSVDFAQTFVIPKDHVPTRVVILADAATVAVTPAH